MASDVGLSRALAFLHELFPTRDIGPATLDAWALVFESWPDDLLQSCAVQAAKEPGRTFFPTPGEVAAYAPPPPVDTLAVLYRIEQLGHYEPVQGWVLPTFEQIREALGDEIARAHTTAGSRQLFADDAKDGTHVTRDIARRTFGVELEKVNKTNPERLRLMPARKPLPMIEAPKERPDIPRLPGPLAGEVAKATKDVA